MLQTFKIDIMKKKLFIRIAWIIILGFILWWIPTQVRLGWAIVWDLLVLYIFAALYMVYRDATQYPDDEA